ncbi:LysR family transcriptional regulator [Paraburkholderia agricolaris]|uniref:LysR family transcriptional regulator n=1 Tax=Paraburkholderia agricolaris TaxID=2152888 RepID=UPI0012909A3F|nr:LysR family transcriptional regulator [Paraburkholderia agricolaris]
MHTLIKWDDLRFFLATAQAGSYSGASKRLRVDRTTVARRIEALERVVGKRLLTQDGSVIRVTDTGRAVLAASQQVSTTIEALEATLQGRGQEIEGTVRIAVSLGLGDAFIDDIVAVQDRHPGIRIELVCVADPMRLVDDREADLGIAERYDRPEKFDCALLGNLEVALYGSAEGDPSQRSASWVGWSDFAPRPFLDWVHESIGHNATISARVNTWDALKRVALAGSGVAPLWCMLAGNDPRLRRLPSTLDHYIALWLVAPADVARQTPQNAVWQFLCERIPGKLEALDG